MATQRHIIDRDRTGKVVAWKSDHGYGFIRRDDMPVDIFVHVKELDGFPQRQDLAVGDRVTFDVAEGPKGPIAVAVRLRS